MLVLLCIHLTGREPALLTVSLVLLVQGTWHISISQGMTSPAPAPHGGAAASEQPARGMSEHYTLDPAGLAAPSMLDMPQHAATEHIPHAAGQPQLLDPSSDGAYEMVELIRGRGLPATAIQNSSARSGSAAHHATGPSPAEQGRQIAEQAWALIQQETHGDSTLTAATVGALQRGLTSQAGSITITLGVHSAPARLAMGVAVVVAAYGLVDQANADIKLVATASSPCTALLSPVSLVTLMVVGVVALVRLQSMTLAAAVSFTLVHRTCSVKTREAVACCYGGKTLGSRGRWGWRIAVVLSWVLGYALAFVGPTAIYCWTYILVCTTLSAKYVVLKGNLHKEYSDRRVRTHMRCTVHPADCS